MKNKLTLVSFGVAALLLHGCELFNGPLHGMGRGAPEVGANGKFIDSDYNLQYFRERVHKDITDEKNKVDPEYDWKRAWRVSFKSWETSQENPQQKKRYVVKLRKEAGLPIWPFMLE